MPRPWQSTGKEFFSVLAKNQHQRGTLFHICVCKATPTRMKLLLGNELQPRTEFKNIYRDNKYPAPNKYNSQRLAFDQTTKKSKKWENLTLGEKKEKIL